MECPLSTSSKRKKVTSLEPGSFCCARASPHRGLRNRAHRAERRGGGPRGSSVGRRCSPVPRRFSGRECPGRDPDRYGPGRRRGLRFGRGAVPSSSRTSPAASSMACPRRSRNDPGRRDGGPDRHGKADCRPRADRKSSSVSRFNLAVPDPDWEAFRVTLRRRPLASPSGNTEPQMKRRLANLMRTYAPKGWLAFADVIKHDATVLEVVRESLTINVSEFFRQPNRYADLQNKYIPELLAERPRKRSGARAVLSAANRTRWPSSSWSDPRGRHTITATDVDEMRSPRRGRGTTMPRTRCVRCQLPCESTVLTRDGVAYTVDPALRRPDPVPQHDLLKEPYPDDLDMVVCRNVIIYFREEAKKTVFDGFANSLRMGGLLFIGGSQMVMRPGDLRPEGRRDGDVPED